MERVADGVYRLGSRWVNWYVVEDDGRLTLVDTGYPGYHRQLAPGLALIGRRVEDVDAVIVTHAHADHVGSVALIHTESGARVLAHPTESDAIRSGDPKRPPNFFADAWRPRFARYLVHAAVAGARTIAGVETVDPVAQGDELDVPGRPRVIHTPGHTPGHCAFLLEGRGVLFSGDALVTRDNVSGRTGPQPIHWSEDDEQTRASFERLRALDADVVLPGHGEPWRR